MIDKFRGPFLPWEKLVIAMNSAPEAIQRLTGEQVRSRLEESGIATDNLIQSIKEIVAKEIEVKTNFLLCSDEVEGRSVDLNASIYIDTLGDLEKINITALY